MLGVLAKMIIWNDSTCDCECIKACRIDEYLDIKKCLCKNRVFGKLVSVCEEEISNTTEKCIDDKESFALFILFH